MNQIYKIDKLKEVGRFVGAQNIQNVKILDATEHPINFQKAIQFWMTQNIQVWNILDVI